MNRKASMAEAERPIVLSDLLLARTAQHDRAAEDAVFRRVYPRIFRIVRAVVRGRKEADDIAQLAAMQVLKSLGTFGGKGTLEGWAERIAFRTAMRMVRRERRHEVMLLPLAEYDLVHHETPERSASKRQLFGALIDQMQQIPAKRRVPLVLHLAYGYTVHEVSEITDASTNTVKARLKKGLKELRGLLDEHPHLLDAMAEETP